MLNEISSPTPRIVVASILNWNTAEMTLNCVERLLELNVPSGLRFDIIIIDNGSNAKDVSLLKMQCKNLPVTVQYEDTNTGFAGGTNIGIAIAKQRNADFIWLVNSDAIINDIESLTDLVKLMDQSPKCGAASPTLALTTPPHNIYFSGSYHDWRKQESVRTNEIETAKNELNRAFDAWVPGTVLFLRLKALEEVGNLDERFFAYYEDDDICSRLSAAGWTSRVCQTISVMHPMPRLETDRPPYYFYLITRNFLLFWSEQTPLIYRKLLFLKLLDRAIFDINKLRRKGLSHHADAASLGLCDFIRKRFGAPNLARSVPFFLRLLIKLMEIQQNKSLNRMLQESSSTPSL